MANLKRIADDCPIWYSATGTGLVRRRINVLNESLRCAIEGQYNHEKSKAGKSTPAISPVDK